ncbi:MAG: 50S ribosomal protein L22 [Alphaproteobacteria bacterium GM202ARS2]|nr:50S ribosomal protein L22 [Alphaproteobacteria bacterium GM202ARS2]
MSKKVTPSPRKDLRQESEAMAKARTLKVSPRKLALVAQLIRGRDVDDALQRLTFSRRRIAQDVSKVLESAIANAENNHQLDVDSLYVARVEVGKSIVMKRWRARARGRLGRYRRFFSNISVVVRERMTETGKKTTEARRGTKN